MIYSFVNNTSLDDTNEFSLEGGPPLPSVIPEVHFPPDFLDKPADVLGAMTVTPDTKSGVFSPARDISLLSR